MRCVIHNREVGAYEERITLWQAAEFDHAIARAEDEVRDHVAELQDSEYAGLAQAYKLFGEPGDGAEVFSLVRDSVLPPADYLDAFFDTGSERRQVE